MLLCIQVRVCPPKVGYLIFDPPAQDFGRRKIRVIASTDALNRDVEKFFDFYRHRVLGVKDCNPHNGHDILARWERDGIIHSIITQNVDGFHPEAGTQALWNCTERCRRYIVRHVKKSTEMRHTVRKLLL